MSPSTVAHLALCALVSGAVATVPPPSQGTDESTRAGAAAVLQSDDDAPAPRARLGWRTPLARLSPMAEGPKLGVQVEESADGVEVVEVFDGTLAASAGLRAGDIILRIGETHVAAVPDIRRALERHEPGSEVSIAVVRSGEGLVKLSARMPEPESAPADDAQAQPGRRPFLGVHLGEATDQGVAIASVVDESAAWFAGLQEGDVLVSIDGEQVGEPETVSRLVAAKGVGDFLSIEYRRDGSTETTRARLGRRGAVPFGMVAPQGLFGGDGDDDGAWRFAPFHGPDGGPQGFGMLGGPHGLMQLWRDGAGPHAGPHGGGVWAIDPDALRRRDPNGAPHAFRLDLDDMQLDLDDMKQKLELHMGDVQDQLDALDVDLQGASQVRIEIKDGVMRIERDGVVEEIELDGDDGGVRVLELHRSGGGDDDSGGSDASGSGSQGVQSFTRPVPQPRGEGLRDA